MVVGKEDAGIAATSYNSDLYGWSFRLYNVTHKQILQ